MKVAVHVYYDVDGFGETWQERTERMDQLAKDTTGRAPISRSTTMLGVRDLLFSFDSEEHASEAKALLVEEGFRFFP